MEIRCDTPEFDGIVIALKLREQKIMKIILFVVLPSF
jgi:hypothetical protein